MNREELVPAGLVYRSGRRQRREAELWDGLDRALSRWGGSSDAGIEALLAAASIEGALADVDDERAGRAAELCDAIAEAWWSQERGDGRAPDRAEVARRRAALAEPNARGRNLVAPVPEGFAYYGLHPGDLARAAVVWLREQGVAPGASVLVLGVRTAGVALSAAVTAALRATPWKIDAARWTVRPSGPPHDRALLLPPRLATAVRRGLERDAHFLVVDEGPGLSGSTFLAVAEALERAGVEPRRITLLGSRAPNPERLLARDAATRWGRFAFRVASPLDRFPSEAAVEWSGGAWRERLGLPRDAWPAVWTAMERAKRVTADQRCLFKYEGLPPFGGEALVVAEALAEAGLGPRPSRGCSAGGIVAMPIVAGSPLGAADLGPEVVDALARYVARRTSALADGRLEHGEDLAELARVNVELELGRTPPAVPRPERPAVRVDGRMLPHEWIASARGELVKVDALAHGDDHLYPGPTDPAWDLAGAIVEWRLPTPARLRLLATYRAASGDDATARIGGFEIAYAAFRTSSCRMAIAGSDADEEPRWRAAHARYRRALAEAIARVEAGRD